MTTAKPATMHNFGDGNGLVRAHQHPKGGGWVAKSALVDETVYVGPNARVYGTAQIRDMVRIEGHARVSDKAQVSGYVTLTGNTWIFEEARVSGTVKVHNTRVCGKVRLTGDQSISDRPLMSSNQSTVS